jgi:protein-tyrosine phosphatase
VGTIEELREHASVLMVCTGNICRSPAAERLARYHWGRKGDITVRSAGTGGLVGEPINLSMRHLMLLDALDTGDFAARRLTAALVDEADLILGMTVRHRKKAMSAQPSALRKTFTLREFARLAEASEAELTGDSPAARLQEIVENAHLYRAPVMEGEDDITDPFGHGTELYEHSYGLIRDAVLSVARVIRSL